MGGPIVRTGTTPKFWENWDRIFADGAQSSKPGAAKKNAAKKKAAKKKSPTAKSKSKPKAGKKKKK